MSIAFGPQKPWYNKKKTNSDVNDQQSKKTDYVKPQWMPATEENEQRTLKVIRNRRQDDIDKFDTMKDDMLNDQHKMANCYLKDGKRYMKEHIKSVKDYSFIPSKTSGKVGYVKVPNKTGKILEN